MQDRADESMTPFASDVRYAEEQRRALRDLLRLSAECAETQQQIVAASESVRQSAETASTRLERRLQRRHERYRTQVKTYWREQLVQVRAQVKQELARLQAHRVEAVNAVAEEVDSTEHRTEQKLEQGQWLAESMYEAAVEQIQNEYKQTKDQVLADRTVLESLADDGEEQLQLFALQPAEIRSAELDDADHAERDAADHVTHPAEAYEAHRKAAEDALRRLGGLLLPKLYRGVVPFTIVIVVCVTAVVLTWWFTEGRDWPATRQLAVNAGSLALAAALILGLGALGRRAAIRQMLDTYRPMHENLDHAHRDLEHRLAQARALRRRKIQEADQERKQERHKVRQRYQPILDDITERRDKAVQKIDDRVAAQRAEMQRRYDEQVASIKHDGQAALDAVNGRYEKYLQQARERYTSQVESSDERTQREQASLERRWKEGLARIEAVVAKSEKLEAERFPSWDDTTWTNWQPPHEQTALLRFGRLHVDMRHVASDAAKQGKYRLEVPKTFDVPALLALPERGSLLIETDGPGRDKAIELLHTVMARLLTTFPPGQVRFTLIDPVGLGQSFAGFMHLADYDDKLVGSRIWTEGQHIDARLTAVTNHMENVIQKYLRNEFKTIDEYNAQAHELAEPYRFVVIADYPHGFSEEAVRRLNSIVTSGPRCGVYALVVRDLRQDVPGGGKAEDLQRRCVQLVHRADKLTWKDDVFGAFPLQVEKPPHEIVLTELLNRVGEQSREAMHVEVPFESIAPNEQSLWTRSAAKELQVPLGRTGATRMQEMRLGTGMAQHVLMAGKTGSGKSTLLHVLITNLALWYSPDEVEFYLVDFKKGVEFKTYATHALPHARAVAIESDREFGLSVLQRLDAELGRRGELFRAAGVQNLADYRAAKPEAVMPRTLLIVDEFQELFSEDDKLAADASLLLDRLVRQGRAFGVHVLLGSQTLAGSSGLPRSTMGQMAVRVALQCSEADAQLIFDDNNSAAKLLSRPGEAIYNDAGGAVEGNSPFQIAWLTEAQREAQLARASAKAAVSGEARERTIVFEGSSDANIAENLELSALLEASDWPEASSSREPIAWLGEPITIKAPTSVVLPRRSGANVLLVGQRDGAVTALMSSMMVSLASQHAVDGAKFVVFDATPDDSRWAGHFKQLAKALPHELKIVTVRDSERVMAQLSALVELVQQRQEDSAAAQDGPAVYVFINGLHRFRMFKRSDEDFGFSFSADDDEPKGESADKQLAELLREGPSLGVHVVAWADTSISFERAVERGAMREFDQRVLFQMSANDSSNLIDSPIANKVGLTRALLYSEAKGTLEKFRPYALPEASWLAAVGRSLQGRGSRASSGDGVGA